MQECEQRSLKQRFARSRRLQKTAVCAYVKMANQTFVNVLYLRVQMQFWYCLFLEVKEMGSQWKEEKLIQLFLRISWLVVIDMIRCTCRETCCQVCVFTDCLFLYRRRLNRVSICRTHFAKLGHGDRKLFINYSHNHSTWCTVWNELLREKAEVVSWVPLSSFDIAYQFPWGLKWAAKERLML